MNQEENISSKRFIWDLLSGNSSFKLVVIKLMCNWGNLSTCSFLHPDLESLVSKFQREEAWEFWMKLRVIDRYIKFMVKSVVSSGPKTIDLSSLSFVHGRLETLILEVVILRWKNMCTYPWQLLLHGNKNRGCWQGPPCVRCVLRTFCCFFFVFRSHYYKRCWSSKQKNTDPKRMGLYGKEKGLLWRPI